MADAPLEDAALLGQRYELRDLVGRGGMAEVYRAHDRVLGRDVAVKMLRALAADEEERARFTDEARTLAQLSHPNLVTVLDAATSDDEPYLVMELVDGPSLAACCRGIALAPARVAAIGAQLADALAHVHAAGIVHRDLKPGNVLLNGDDRAQLTDFGLARILSATVRHTITGATVGTPAYLAPEQVRGGEITPAVDVYALGLVLLEALTGACPYQGLPVEAALARLTTPPVIPSALPEAWQALLRDMTALDPAERPTTESVAASLRELAAQAEPATVGGTSSRSADPRVTATDRAPTVDPAPRGRPWRGSGRRRLGIAAAVALLVTLGGAWYSTAGQADRPPAATAQQGPDDAREGGRVAAAEGRSLKVAGGLASIAPRSGARAASRPEPARAGSAGAVDADVSTAASADGGQASAASGDVADVADVAEETAADSSAADAADADAGTVTDVAEPVTEDTAAAPAAEEDDATTATTKGNSQKANKANKADNASSVGKANKSNKANTKDD